jgi:hypothetical protein
VSGKSKNKKGKQELDRIVREIQGRKNQNLPLVIYYKDESLCTRTFYQYSVCWDYLDVVSWDNSYRYLLSDIREIISW